MRQAAKQIADAMPQVMSIDNFLNQRRGEEAIEQCGKLAITLSIISTEQKSSLYVGTNQKERTLRTGTASHPIPGLSGDGCSRARFRHNR